MNLTIRMLKKYGACIEAVDWAKTQKDKSYKALFATCIAEDHLDWVNWIIARLLNNENRVRYTIYAARQGINFYEDKYSGDDRPRKAIQAAKKYLKNPSKENATHAADAAYAAHAAADAAYAAYATDIAAYAAYATDIAAYAAYAAFAAADAAYAAYAAFAAADATAYATAYATFAAAHATHATADAAYKDMLTRILKYGYRLLIKQENEERGK